MEGFNKVAQDRIKGESAMIGEVEETLAGVALALRLRMSG